MKANMNRGVVVFTSILAGLLIGLFAGIYIYYAWAPPEMVLRDAPPRMLYHDTKSNTPQYRDFYAVRAANKFQGEMSAGVPNALQNVYDVLGVTTGDASFDDALTMVRDAERVATLENRANGDQGRFTANDQLALTSLVNTMQSAKDTGNVPAANTAPSAPAVARSNARLVGFILLLVWALLLGIIVYVVDHWVGPRMNPVATINQRFNIAPSRVEAEPYVPAPNVTVNVGPTSPGSVGSVYSPAARGAHVVTSETPLATFAPTIYRHGDDHYDEDFAINGPMGELIGECGASIAERIGGDTPARVSALALWVFDKNDFQSTTKVLMTDYAWNDSVTRNKLKARGDAVLAQDGGVFEILTSTLRVEVQVSDLQLNPDSNPPRGYFQSVTLTFAVYKRQG
ncbi:MAG: hypothetical protein M1546_17390 [Chloroflexi bacterium]|nr:hypothetical protein [Chloroflexota bacterium]